MLLKYYRFKRLGIGGDKWRFGGYDIKNYLLNYSIKVLYFDFGL